MAVAAFDPTRVYLDERVRFGNSTAEPERSGTPSVANAGRYHDPLVDRIGLAMGEHRPEIVGSAVLGAALGATIGGGSAKARIGKALLGMAAGPALVTSSAMLLERRFDFIGGPRPADRPGGVREAVPVVRDEPMRVMSFNIREGIGPEGEVVFSTEQLEDVAAAIRADRPDIVLLQEVSDRSMLSGMHDQVALLERYLEPDGLAFAPTAVRMGGQAKGSMVLTFNGFTVDDAQALRHPDRFGSSMWRRINSLYGPWNDRGKGPLPPSDIRRGYLPRVTLDTVVATPAGNEIRVLDTHLSGTDAQRAQLDPLAPTLAAWNGPTLFGGDFNVPLKSPEAARERELLGNIGLTDAWSSAEQQGPDRNTFSARNPHRSIDRIYASPEFDVAKAWVSDQEPTSDHKALVMDMTLRADR